MGSLTVTCTHNPARFLERAGPLLLAHPVEHSVLLTRSAQALEQAGPDVEPNLWLWVEDDQGQVVAAAMQTPPYPVALSLASPEAVMALADEVHRRRPEVPGVGGVLRARTGWLRWTTPHCCSRGRRHSRSRPAPSPAAPIT